MGKREEQQSQESLWIAHTELAAAPGHPFYQKLNELLDAEHFDGFVEGLCSKFYAPQFGRPSLLPGIYFRSLLIGYFEGIEGERGIAWRVADSLALRRFLGIALTERTPDHSTLSRTRRLIDLETHQQVFAWVLGLLADRGLLEDKRIGIDATTLEANAGVPGDKSSSLGRKAEHAVDMDSSAVVAVTLQAADLGDTTTIHETLAEAGMAVAELVKREAESYPEEEPKVNVDGIEELVADKGYQSGAVVEWVGENEVTSYIPERMQAGKRNWDGKQAEQQAVEANHGRVTGE